MVIHDYTCNLFTENTFKEMKKKNHSLNALNVLNTIKNFFFISSNIFILECRWTYFVC